jgi:hypothetical protein
MSELIYNNSLDYGFFVADPQGKNFIEFPIFKDKFHIDLIYSMQISYTDDRVSYWMYFNIPHHNAVAQSVLKKSFDYGYDCKVILGNMKYYLNGTMNIIQTTKQNNNQLIEVKASVIVHQASKIHLNLREEVKTNRINIMDLEE